MTKFIDFVPKRPQPAVESHPVAKKPVAPEEPQVAPRKRQIAPRGLRMDFVRRPSATPVAQVKTKKTIQISIASKPVVKPAAKPVTKPAPKPAPKAVIKPVIRTAPKPAPKPASMPALKTVVRPVIKTSTRPAMKTAPRPVARPAMRPVEEELLDDEPLMDDDELSLALAGFADDDDSSLGLIDNLSKEASDLEDELNALDELDAISDDLESEIADFVEEPKPIFEKKKADVKDTSRFGLGGRSPFLSSVKVDKRPLSSLASSESKTVKTAEKTPLKNSYRDRIKQVISKDKESRPEPKPLRRRETTIISTPESHSHNIGLAIAIVLTIVLGALIGAVLYLVFFQ